MPTKEIGLTRLSGRGTVPPGKRLTRLRAFVAEHGVTTLLKGKSTLIAGRHAVHINSTRTAAKAEAAHAGAYWHGRPGELVALRRPLVLSTGGGPARIF